jgi:Xaa-Pro aminopeptidase
VYHKNTMKNLFASNRERIIARLGGGIIVLSAYTAMQRSNDMAYAFEQEANFWWLTGIEAADWQLIVDGTRGKSWLVAPEVSGSHEIFDGSLSAEKAQKISGVDAIVSQDEGASLLRDLAKKHSVVYTIGEHPHAEYFDFSLNSAPKKLHELLERTFNSVQGCRKELSQLRAIKQPEEITRIKKAIALTTNAFEEYKNQLDSMQYEYEVEAYFSHYFRSRGAKGHAYDPIVAGGKNACTLHYVANDTRLKKRELLLLDIGARAEGYAADITRTYAFGEPTKRQRAVHAAVQTAQSRIIKLLKPELSVEHYQREVDKIMTDALLSLGLMKSATDQDSYRKYFPHAISHGLGVDVHDSLGAPRTLQPNMVLTVEPGIYIPEEGIGVRIEDDILITPTGHKNLSARLSTDL